MSKNTYVYKSFKYISRNTPFSNATGHRGVACTKLEICTSKHRHRIVSGSSTDADLAVQSTVQAAEQMQIQLFRVESRQQNICRSSCSDYIVRAAEHMQIQLSIVMTAAPMQTSFSEYSPGSSTDADLVVQSTYIVQAAALMQIQLYRVHIQSSQLH